MIKTFNFLEHDPSQGFSSFFGSLERNVSDLGLRMLYRRNEYVGWVDYLWGMGRVELYSLYLNEDVGVSQVKT